MNISDFCKSNVQLLQQYKRPKEDLLQELVKTRLNESFKSCSNQKHR